MDNIPSPNAEFKKGQPLDANIKYLRRWFYELLAMHEDALELSSTIHFCFFNVLGEQRSIRLRAILRVSIISAKTDETAKVYTDLHHAMNLGEAGIRWDWRRENFGQPLRADWYPNLTIAWDRDVYSLNDELNEDWLQLIARRKEYLAAMAHWDAVARTPFDSAAQDLRSVRSSIRKFKKSLGLAGHLTFNDDRFKFRAELLKFLGLTESEIKGYQE